MINDALIGSEPQLNLMFYKGNQISATHLPGFISVPMKFEVQQLREFVK